MDGFTLLVFGLIAGGVITTLILAKITSHKWVWYTPSIVGGITISYLWYEIMSGNTDGYAAIGYIFLMFLIGSIVMANVVTNIFLHIKGVQSLKRNNAHTDENNKKEA